MRHFLFAAAACLTVVCAEREARAADKKTSVLGLLCEEGGETFAETFSTELRGGVDARPAAGHTGKTQDLEQLALAFGCPDSPDPACLKEIGEGLESTHLIYGTTKKASSKPPYSFEVEASIFNVKTGKIEKSTTILIPSDKQSSVYLQEAADRIVGELFNEKPSTTIIIQSNVSGAQILLDADLLGETAKDPVWFKSIAPGKYRLIVKKEGYQLFEKKVDVQAGARLDIEAPLVKAEQVEDITEEIAPLDIKKKKEKKKLPSWRVWTGLALTVTGVGLAGGGISQSVKALDYNDQLDKYTGTISKQKTVCECYSEGDTTGCFDDPGIKEQESWSSDVAKVQDLCGKKGSVLSAQYALYSVGGVIGAVGLYFLVDGMLKWNKEKKPAAARFQLVPTLTPSSGALSLVGTF